MGVQDRVRQFTFLHCSVLLVCTMVKALMTMVTVAAAQKAGTLTKENHPALSWSTCTESGCESKQGKVTIDANWRWTHKTGESTNCYTGNKWDCADVETCTSECVVEGADQEYTNTYGVQSSGNKLELGFVTQGPYSKNKEFTYTVDDSKLGCGLNGAL